MTTTVGLWVTLEARPGREDALAAFLRQGAVLVEEDEPLTLAWFAVRTGASTFAIFDAFAEEAGREAHLSGPVAQALRSVGADLLAAAPVVRPVDVVASHVR
jgi:quinol monooxygenase YgiN